MAKFDLDSFFKVQKSAIIAFLTSKKYGLSKDDAEDIYQEACLSLYKDIANQKKIDYINTYFNRICVFKALNFKRDRKTIPFSNLFKNNRSKEDDDDEYQSSQVDILLGFDENDDEKALFEEKLKLAKKILKQLPEPCNDLLWAHYCDNIKYKEVATMFGYKNSSVAKVTSNQCVNRFKNKLNETLKSQ